MPQKTINQLSEHLQFPDPVVTPLYSSLAARSGVEISMLRLDAIHPIISGNKIYKLFYFLQEALASHHKTIITFGGAYSNHLAATAFSGNQLGINTIGIVRGEKPASLSPTLLFCKKEQMQLEFISRAGYRNYNFSNNLAATHGVHTLIPEGGYSTEGARGASLIASYFNDQNYTHICVAAGTATTLAGIINGTSPQQEVIGFSVLKGMDDMDSRLKELGADHAKKYSLNKEYHFGGYAKKNEELIRFMNHFYKENSIPLDFVYTGKMMFGVYDLVEKGNFSKGSKILCIHTGGLQGNQSLPAGTLIF